LKQWGALQFLGGALFAGASEGLELFPVCPKPFSPGESEDWEYEETQGVEVKRTLEIKMNEVHTGPGNATARTFFIEQ